MVYTLRVVLDVENEVFCQIKITEDANLEELHLAIKKAFEIESNEMASFYLSNYLWDQGEEIPLEDFDEIGVSMASTLVGDAFKNDQLIYVYDLMLMFTFLIEKVKEEPKKAKSPKFEIELVYGKMPKEAQEKIMESVEEEDEFSDLEESQDAWSDDYEDLDDLEESYY
ncbi:MAG: hypothetical protein C4K58_07555 [Flavobacteriaceae bacterium]|nr:MAG: hypothetical protein C4K58_07555 [Flavobacteriaceae bacterium]